MNIKKVAVIAVAGFVAYIALLVFSTHIVVATLSGMGVL